MPHEIHNRKRTLFLYQQGRGVEVTGYQKGYKGLIDVINFNGGSIGDTKGLVDSHLTINGDYNPPNEDKTNKAVSEARNATIACEFILGTDKTRFRKLMEDLENSFTQGDVKYPVDITELYKLLTNWKQFVPTNRRSAHPSEAAFTNFGTEEIQDTTFSNIGQVNRAPQPDITTIQ